MTIDVNSMDTGKKTHQSFLYVCTFFSLNFRSVGSPFSSSPSATLTEVSGSTTTAAFSCSYSSSLPLLVSFLSLAFSPVVKEDIVARINRVVGMRKKGDVFG
jgi:hypothetical protein